MLYKLIISTSCNVLFLITLNANAALVAFEFSGFTNESKSALNIPWGSFAGGRVVYDTESVFSTTTDGSGVGYLFNSAPAEFTFEIYKNSNKEIMYALAAGQVSGPLPDLDVKVFNSTGNSGFDSLRYIGNNAKSLVNINGQPTDTVFELALGGNSALLNSTLPDYIPDLTLFPSPQPEVVAWSINKTDGTKSHLFTIRNLSFIPIDTRNLSAVPLPGSFIFMLSGVVLLAGMFRSNNP